MVHLDPWDPYGSSRELAAISCPLISTSMPWRASTHVRTHTYTKCLKNWVTQLLDLVSLKSDWPGQCWEAEDPESSCS